MSSHLLRSTALFVPSLVLATSVTASARGAHLADATATASQSGVAHDSSLYALVALRQQMIPKHFIHEVFLGLAFNMD